MRSSPSVFDGMVYIGSYDGVYCLNATSGETIWCCGWSCEMSAPAIADNKLYINSCSDSNKTFCLNAYTGNQIWNYTAGSELISSPAVANGKVYFGCLDSNIYCLNADTGAMLWSFKTGDDIYSSPSIANDKMYIGSCDGHVYCFGTGKNQLHSLFLLGIIMNKSEMGEYYSFKAWFLFVYDSDTKGHEILKSGERFIVSKENQTGFFGQKIMVGIYKGWIL